MRRLVVTIVCMLAMTVVARSGGADTVDVDFIGVSDGGGGISVYLNGSTSPVGETTGWYDFQLNNSVSLGIGETPVSVKLFCYELNQYTDSWGDDTSGVTYDILDPSDGPLPDTGASVPPWPHPVGVERSNLLKSLYALYYDTAILSSTGKKAFQMAIWEISHENTLTDETLGSSYDVSNGTFDVYDNDATVTANNWLDALTQSTLKAALKAFVSSTNQCYLYWDEDSYETEVPCPAAVVQLAGLGLMVCMVAVRRRRTA